MWLVCLCFISVHRSACRHTSPLCLLSSPYDMDNTLASSLCPRNHILTTPDLVCPSSLCCEVMPRHVPRTWLGGYIYVCLLLVSKTVITSWRHQTWYVLPPCAVRWCWDTCQEPNRDDEHRNYAKICSLHFTNNIIRYLPKASETKKLPLSSIVIPPPPTPGNVQQGPATLDIIHFSAVLSLLKIIFLVSVWTSCNLCHCKMTLNKSIQDGSLKKKSFSRIFFLDYTSTLGLGSVPKDED